MIQLHIVDHQTVRWITGTSILVFPIGSTICELESLPLTGVYVSTDFWTEVVELPILKSPQYMLCLVSTDAKVETVQWNKELLPDLQIQVIINQRHQYMSKSWHEIKFKKLLSFEAAIYSVHEISIYYSCIQQWLCKISVRRKKNMGILLTT